MTAPTNTYNSNTDLSLGQVPQVDDPDLYKALLDIHNAIESLLKSSDQGDSLSGSESSASLLQLALNADLLDRIGSGELLTVDDEGITCDNTFMTCDRDEM